MSYNFFSCLCILIINIIFVSFKFFYLLIRNIKSKFLF